MTTRLRRSFWVFIGFLSVGVWYDHAVRSLNLT
jgi:hypothetical protein